MVKEFHPCTAGVGGTVSAICQFARGGREEGNEGARMSSGVAIQNAREGDRHIDGREVGKGVGNGPQRFWG